MSSIPPYDSFILNLERFGKNDAEVQAAIEAYKTANELQTKIETLWESVQTNQSASYPELRELKELSAALGSAADDLDMRLQDVFEKHQDKLFGEEWEDIQKGNHELFSNKEGYAITAKFKDFSVAAEQSARWNAVDARLEKRKNESLAGIEQPTLEQEVEALDQLAHNDPAKKYWYDTLLAKEFNKRSVVGDGSCALRVFAGIAEVEELKSEDSEGAALATVQTLRDRMVDYIGEHWDDYGPAMPYESFEEYEEAMRNSKTYLDHQELQALSDMTGKTLKIYKFDMPKVDNGQIAPSVEIKPKVPRRRAGEVLFYHDRSRGHEHYDILLKK